MLGERIKEVRLSLGKTQEEFGKMFNPPVPKSAVSRWEHGGNPNIKRLKKIAKLGNVTVTYLLGTDNCTDMTENEQILYNFFVTFGQAVGSISYPITILACWTSNEDETNIIYPYKDKIIDAYCSMDGMDKPLYEAIKTIKGWK